MGVEVGTRTLAKKYCVLKRRAKCIQTDCRAMPLRSYDLRYVHYMPDRIIAACFVSLLTCLPSEIPKPCLSTYYIQVIRECKTGRTCRGTGTQPCVCPVICMVLLCETTCGTVHTASDCSSNASWLQVGYLVLEETAVSLRVHCTNAGWGQTWDWGGKLDL